VKTRIQRWGNSQGLRFPREVLRKICIEIGDEVELIVRQGAIVVKPSRQVRRKYSLAQLTARMPRVYKVAEEDWGGRAGKEIW